MRLSGLIIGVMLCGVPAYADDTPLGAPFRDCGECPEMVFVRAGAVDLGLERAPAGITRARIASRLAVGRHEITFDEWDTCVAEGGCRQLADQGWGRGRRPVVNVGYKDAEAYVAWLRSITGQRYRLPTQHEWEYYVRSGVTTENPWAEFTNGNCDPCDPTYAGIKTAPVGSYKPNAFGLYDVLGNVWEWTADCVDACIRRLMLGGSFRSGALFIAGGVRFEPVEGKVDLIDVGFRVVRDESNLAAR
jgi:formylglycine-generating enzyme required for sulfatase activity